MASSGNGGETVAGVKMNGHQGLLPVSMPAVTAKGSSKELRHGRTAHNMSSSSLRKKSDMTLVSKVRCVLLRDALANLQEVFLGTKLALLFPAIPLAIAAFYFHFGSAWLFGLSLLGLVPLAERVSFLTEQIAYYTGPTVGGLLNATCGNATEVIIALFALWQGKVDVVKCSLVGSVLSNLLLVLGSSLLVGGARVSEQTFDRKQADIATGLLMLGVLCHLLPLMFKISTGGAPGAELSAAPTLQLSRACSIVMLLLYAVYIFFQLKTHRNIFEAEEDSDDDDNDDLSSDDAPIIGLASGITWLVGMTAVIAVLSEYVVSTIEDAADSWGLSVSFISVILLPIVGNAAEHAGALIFAYKDKLDITMGVALGSAAQISVFVVPLSVVAAWVMGVDMDLDFNILQTAALLVSVLLTSATLQDGTSHYLKGLVLVMAYVAIGACFFVYRTAPAPGTAGDLVNKLALGNADAMGAVGPSY